MKKTIIILLSISILSCGTKKELAKTQQNNSELSQKVSELQTKLGQISQEKENLEEQNQECRKRVSEMTNSLENQKSYTEIYKQKNERLTNSITEMEKQMPKENVEYIEVVEFEEEKKQIPVEEIFTIVEQMPMFPGGEEKLMEFLSNNLKYPEQAKENEIQGKVYIQFVVNENGSLEDHKVLRGLSKECDEEAKRVMKLMPNWTPGQQRGKAVKTKMVIPISFVLSQSAKK